MFTQCLVCHTPFSPNEELEYFSTSTRVAYDAVRRRLWAICRSCKRWSLAPIEERWEALEELEKVVKDRAKLLSQTDNVAPSARWRARCRSGRPGRTHRGGLVEVWTGAHPPSSEASETHLHRNRSGWRRDCGRVGQWWHRLARRMVSLGERAEATDPGRPMAPLWCKRLAGQPALHPLWTNFPECRPIGIIHS